MTKLVSIPFNVVFLDRVAEQWIETVYNTGQTLPRGFIIVPNQRTVKGLVNSFIRMNQGKPLLLPRIISIGAIDEAGPMLNGRDELLYPPSVHPMKRLSILTNLIIEMNNRLGHRIQAGEAWNMANSLAELMDEAEWIGCDLCHVLSQAADGEYAQHWQDILQFLSIITDVWPKWLLDNHLMNPVARTIALLKSQMEMWHHTVYKEPIWAVGFLDARPVIVDFLSSLLQLPQGRLIVPGIQEDLPEKSWNNLPLTHPYTEMAHMFAALKVKRADFQKWHFQEKQIVAEERVNAFQQILLPAENLEQWLINRQPVTLSNCFLIEPVNQQQEAVAIALIIRDALETPQKRIALVTPDRHLAMRVSLELSRWGVIADDSAGEPLSKTSAAVLLSLFLQACIEDFTPVSLLSLLKHPFVCCGFKPNRCREYSRLLEVHILRQFSVSGLSTMQAALLQKLNEIKSQDKATLSIDLIQFSSLATELVNLLAFLQKIVNEFLQNSAKRPLSQWVTALVQAVERLVFDGTENKEDILWQAEEGNALAEHLRNLIVETTYVKAIDLQEFTSIINASYKNIMVHSRRALRGRKEQELHPRVYIWGLLEARLQHVDTVILGGLSEGVWPETVDCGPWLSRPMREKIGMRIPDVEVGRMAYDFMAICCSIPEVILSSPLRRENAPVVQSRWVVRLKAWLKGRNSTIQKHPALEWAKLLDQPQDVPKPMAYPMPKPAVELRPKSISITDVEYWLKDPYAIYAKKILNLRKLIGLEEDRSASIFGMIVHAGLKDAYEHYAWQWTLEGVEQALLGALDKRRDVLPSHKKWWRARLLKIAYWVFHHEQKQRNGQELPQSYLEKAGHYCFQLPGGLNFTLKGIVDRIRLNIDGTVEIFDYKTGSMPSKENVESGSSPQLPLKAAMASYGAFGKELMEHKIIKYYFWQLKGGTEEGKEVSIDNIQREEDKMDLSERYWYALQNLIVTYCDKEQPYLSRPRPYLIKEYLSTVPRFGDYKHLARVLEWGMNTESE